MQMQGCTNMMIGQMKARKSSTTVAVPCQAETAAETEEILLE